MRPHAALTIATCAMALAPCLGACGSRCRDVGFDEDGEVQVTLDPAIASPTFTLNGAPLAASCYQPGQDSTGSNFVGPPIDARSAAGVGI